MSMTAITRPSATRLQIALCVFSLTSLLTLSVSAQTSREKVAGVQNFGKVTDLFYRGGKVTPAGVESLAAMGVRTIIDLRDDESPGEPEACERNGVKYFKFPMSGHETPDSKTVDRILALVENAEAPVYVHCSAGKHRAGTIAALYRTRVQGWPMERAWKEQQSYGFGVPQEHPELYSFVYGNDRLVETEAREIASSDDNGKSSHKGKDKDKDKDKKSKSHKKEGKELKDKEKDSHKDAAEDEDDQAVTVADNVRDDRGRGETHVTAAPTAKAPVDATVGSLTASGNYIALKDAIKRARSEGGAGDLLKVDLEWDAARTLPTWDVTFSSGEEYEIDANSGAMLGKKVKAPAKVSVLSPLGLEGNTQPRFISFDEIIRRAEASQKQKVLEIELKRIKGRAETVFEIAMLDGTTISLDAITGEPVAGS